MSAHTPGPWTDNGEHGGDQRIVGAPDKLPIIYIDDDGACGDPECCGPPQFRIVISANDLSLILAAPELLEALVEAEFICRVIAEGSMVTMADARKAQDIARAAIAKANGNG